MRKRVLSLFIMLVLVITGSLSHAQEVTFYGYNNYPLNGTTVGPLSFYAADGVDPIATKTEYVGSGEFVNDVWYAVTYTVMQSQKMVSNFVTIDKETGDITVIARASTLLADMAHDVTSGKTYGVLNGTSMVYTIDLTTGATTQAFTMTGGPTAYWTLAVNAAGEMYTIGTDLNLYKVNKTSGAVTKIGGTGLTGIYSIYIQSMAFEPKTGVLYWTAGNGQFCSVSTETGAATELFNMSNYRIASLVPVLNAEEGTPNSVKNLTATPGAQGAKSLKLTWDNPSLTAQGETLTALTAIEIYRNDKEEAIHKITNPVIGKTNNEWTDASITQADNYTYTIVPKNEKGEGIKSRVSAFVGPDKPKAVTGLSVAKEGNNAVLSWTAPSEGANDGWLDPSSLKYKIIRQPGDLVLSEATTVTTYTDKSITELNYYSYDVIAYNTSGEGDKVTSNEILLGEALTVPWNEDFSTSSHKLWTFINPANDYSKWAHFTYSQRVEISASYTTDNDDWLISPPITLEANKKYQLTWTNATGSDNKEARYSVTLGKSNTAAAQTTTLFPETTVLSTSKVYQSILIEVEEAGDYYFGWYCNTPMARGSLYIDDITLAEPSNIDMQAMKVSGYMAPIANSSTTNTVLVKNLGVAPAKSFQVKLIDKDDNELGSATYSGDDLNFGDEAWVEVSWTPTATGTLAIRGLVSITGDNNPDNNTSGAFNVLVQPEGIVSYDIMDEENTEPWIMLPMNHNTQSAASQVVYTAKELGEIGEGTRWMSGVFYYHDALDLDYTVSSVRIYMANTEEDSYETWVPSAEMLEVYSGSVTYKAGETSTFIPFSKPFCYKGENLVVTNVRGYNTNMKEVKFHSSVPVKQGVDRSLYYSGNASFSFTQEGMLVDSYPNTTFLAYTTTDNSITGKVVNQAQEAMEGVTVKINGQEVLSDENGEYTLLNTPPFGSVAMTAVMFGYYDETTTVTVDAKEKTANFTMRVRPVTKVTGKVKNEEGVYLENATVKLTGYANYEVSTDAEGVFLIEEVFNNMAYALEISLKGYEIHTINPLGIYDYAGLRNVGEITLKAIPSVTVTGKVKNEEGTALANATIKLAGYEDYQATTDAEGAFSIAGVYVNQEYAITVTAEGYFDYEATISVVEEDLAIEDIQLTLIPPTVTVSGKVKSDKGNYLTDATVKITGTNVDFETTTDSNGAFSIADIYVNQEYTITVTAEGHHEYTATVEVAESDKALEDIELQHILIKVTVAGKVKSSKGGYLANASVTLLVDEDIKHQTNTDSNGAFSIAEVLENTSYTIQVAATDYEIYKSTVTVVESDITLEDIELQYIPIKVSIAGKVKSDKGDYLAGASVVLSEGDIKHEVTTGSDGAFVIADVLESKTYTIKVSATGYEAYESTVKVEQKNITLEDIELVFIPTTVNVSGKVTNRQGTALADASVKLTEGNIKHEVKTNADGTFKIEDVLMDKTYQIEVSTAEYVAYSATVKVEKTDIALGTIVLTSVDIDNVYAYEVKMYPNPAKSFVSIDLDHASVVSIYNLNGKNIYQKEFEAGTAQVDINSLNEGVYMVEVNNAEGKVVKKLIVKK